MQLDDDRTADITARLRRVEGQVRGIQRMLDEGRECSDVITQFAAAIRALEHAGYKYFAATLAECAIDPDKAAEEGYSVEQLEKMFLRLT